MLKDQEVIGAFSIFKQHEQPFTVKQIELVKNFAAQAVFAIENARLLNELRQRTTDLTEALEATTVAEATKESWCEADTYRIAGEIALLGPEPDASKARVYSDRALVVARAQQAKSWELRAAMSMARLWRDQGKQDEARELLAPVYGWFTEGFDTRDLKEAKALLDEL